MQQESENDLLESKLDGLDSADVVIGWDKSAAWVKLEATLETRERRAIPLWLYTTAAAALLLIGFFFFRKDATKDFSVAQQPKIEVKKISVQAIKPVIAVDTFIKTKTINNVAFIARKHSNKAIQPTKITPVITVSEEPVVTIKPVPVIPTIVKAVKIKKTFSEPVYTLNEIMDEVPEREEKPKTFTGIFHLKPATTKDNEPTPNNNRIFSLRPNQASLYNDN